MNTVLFAQLYQIKQNKCDMEKLHDSVKAEMGGAA
jgi:hypothetical protein